MSFLDFFSKKTECLLSAYELGKHFLNHRFGRAVYLLPILSLILFWYSGVSDVLITRWGRIFAGSGSHLAYCFHPVCICVALKRDDPSFLFPAVFSHYHCWHPYKCKVQNESDARTQLNNNNKQIDIFFFLRISFQLDLFSD